MIKSIWNDRLLGKEYFLKVYYGQFGIDSVK